MSKQGIEAIIEELKKYINCGGRIINCWAEIKNGKIIEGNLEELYKNYPDAFFIIEVEYNGKCITYKGNKDRFTLCSSGLNKKYPVLNGFGKTTFDKPVQDLGKKELTVDFLEKCFSFYFSFGKILGSLISQEDKYNISGHEEYTIDYAVCLLNDIKIEFPELDCRYYEDIIHKFYLKIKTGKLYNNNEIQSQRGIIGSLAQLYYNLRKLDSVKKDSKSIKNNRKLSNDLYELALGIEERLEEIIEEIRETTDIFDLSNIEHIFDANINEDR